MSHSENKAIYDLNITTVNGLVSSHHTKQVAEQVIASGQEKCNRIVINIVGHERQGKTSLKRKMMGLEYNPNEECTVGFESDLVCSDSVTTAWEKTNTEYSEFEEMVGFHTSRHLTSTDKQKLLDQRGDPEEICGKIDETASTKKETNGSNRSRYSSVALVLLKLVALALVDPFCNMVGIRECFAIVLFLLLVIACLSYGFQNGMGIGLGVAISVIIPQAIMMSNNLVTMTQTLEVTFGKYSLVPTLLVIYSALGLVGGILGWLLGASFGFGIGLAMCYMDRPNLGIIGMTQYCLHLVAFEIGTTVGILSLKNRFVNAVFLVLLTLLSSFKSGNSVVVTIQLLSGYAFGFYFVWFVESGRVAARYLEMKLGRVLRRVFQTSIGTVIGLMYCLALGWNYGSFSWLRFFTPPIMLCFLETYVYIFDQSKRDNIDNSIAENVDEARREPVLFENKILTKLELRDYAGHKLYHTLHHVFMADHSIYLLVFSLAEAANNLDEVFERYILYWLHSIYTHVRHPHSFVFLIGSHRDHPQAKAKLYDICQFLKSNLPSVYRDRIVWNENNIPLFCVENSVSGPNDADLGLLKRKILDKAQGTNHMKEQYPIRWRAFKDAIHKAKEKGKFASDIGTYEEVFDVAKNGVCKISDQDELNELLDLYTKTGDMIYKKSDQVLSKHVFLNPQILVNIMAGVVHIPPESSRVPGYIAEWDELKYTGFCSRRLLEHAIKIQFEKKGQDVPDVDAVIRLLVAYNLVCNTDQIYDDDTASSRNTKGSLESEIPNKISHDYVVPENLPYFDSDSHGLPWFECTCNTTVGCICGAPKQVDFFFDFKYFKPDVIFQRLICMCLAMSDAHVSRPVVFKQLGVFNLGMNFAYRLELCLPAQDVVSDQNLIKLSVRSANENNPCEVLDAILGMLGVIIARDFPNLEFFYGPECPYCKTDDRSSSIKHKCIAQMGDVESSLRPTSTMSTPELIRWCNGRMIKILNGKTRKGHEASCDNGMTNKDRAVLRSNRMLIVENVDIEHILDYLIQHDVLNVTMKEELLQHAARGRRTGALLDLLPTRGPKAFGVFLDALNEHYPFIVEMMKDV